MANGKLPRGICPVCDGEYAYFPRDRESGGREARMLRHIDRSLNGENNNYPWCEGQGKEPIIHPYVNTSVKQIKDVVAGVDGDNMTKSGTGGYTPTPEEAAQWAQAKLDATLGTDLGRWWLKLAKRDIAAMAPKAVEYSAYDLILVGRAMADTLNLGLGQPEVSYDELDSGDPAAAEIACWFYILGKVGRAIGGIKEGRLPSRDTCDDVRIYATMIARIKDTGAWPGTSD